MVARKDGLPKAPKRPEVHYGPEISAYICEQVALGRGVKRICREDPGMPTEQTVLRWRMKYPEFDTKLTYARQLAGDDIWDQVGEGIEKLKEMAEDREVSNAAVTAIRASIQFNMQRAAVLQPKKFSERTRADVATHQSLADLSLNDLDKQLAQVEQQLAIEGSYTVDRANELEDLSLDKDDI